MKGFFERIGGYIERRYWLVLILSLLFIIAAMVPASRIEMASGTDTMISTDTKEYQDYIRFAEHFGSDIIVIMVKADPAAGLEQLLQDDNLRAMAKVREAMNDQQKYPVVTVLGPDMYLEQAIVQWIADGRLPEGTTLYDLTVEERLELVRDPETGQISSMFAQVFPDEHHALTSIFLQGNLESEVLKDVVEATEDSVDSAEFPSQVDPIITGLPALFNQIDSMFMRTTMQMVLLAVALLFIILALIFKVRGAFPWRWLPLIVVIIGVIYTFGLMGVISLPMTMVSMAVFPIMIGLGIDYGIQFHNRYDEEALRGLSVADAIRDTVKYIGPAVLIALIAGSLGFVALFFSPVPMIQDFGLLLIIGVVMSYIVAIFPLTAILYWHDRRKYNNKKKAARKSSWASGEIETIGFIEKSLLWISPRVIRNPMIILPIAIGLTVGGLVMDSNIKVVTDQSTFINEKMTAIQNLKELEDLSGRHTSFNVLIETDGGQSSPLLEPATLEWMKSLEERFQQEGQAVLTDDGEPVISTVTSIADLVFRDNEGQLPPDADSVRELIESMDPSDTKNFINADFSAANMVIDLKYTSHEKESDVKDVLDAVLATSPAPDEVDATITGGPVISLKVVKAITGGRTRMTVIGIGFIFAALLVLFRFSLVRAILGTLPIVLVIGWSALAMWITGIEFTPLTATFGALIMGIGVEYTILLMTRYYEERDRDEAPFEAMTTALTKIGRAVSVSAFTTIGGFAALLIARDFPILTDFGIVTMIDVFLALAAAMLVLPPLIVWIDGWWSGRRGDRMGGRTA